MSLKSVRLLARLGGVGVACHAGKVGARFTVRSTVILNEASAVGNAGGGCGAIGAGEARGAGLGSRERASKRCHVALITAGWVLEHHDLIGGLVHLNHPRVLQVLDLKLGVG